MLNPFSLNNIFDEPYNWEIDSIPSPPSRNRNLFERNRNRLEGNRDDRRHMLQEDRPGRENNRQFPSIASYRHYLERRER